MLITKMSLPRRTFLRGMGTTLALPLLDAMVPALSAMRNTAANPVRRFGAVYVGNGANMSQWTPATEGAGFELSPILKPLEALRDRTIVVTGLDNWPAMDQGDTGGQHSRSKADRRGRRARRRNDRSNRRTGALQGFEAAVTGARA